MGRGDQTCFAGAPLVMASTNVCKRCKSNVVNGLKCVDCDNYFHNSCAKRMNNVIFLEECVIKCCVSEQVEVSDVDFYDALNTISDVENKVDIRIFKYVLKQKDNIICELKEKVKFLIEHIDLLKKSSASTLENINKVKISEEINIATSKDSDNSVDTDNAKNVNSPPCSFQNQNKPTNEKNVINSNGNKSDSVMENNTNSKKETWVDVVRRKPKRLVVVGNKNECESNSNLVKLKGVPKTTSLHVYRLMPDTTTDHIIKFLKPNFPEVTCEQLASRHPEEYASFKINIFEENVKAVMEPNLWPASTCIRYFLVPRPKLPKLKD